jgi:SM-20-related protein
MGSHQSTGASKQQGQLNQELMQQINHQLRIQGWCMIENALPTSLISGLQEAIASKSSDDFKPATIGRQENNQSHTDIRRDHIHWIDGNASAHPSEQDWLDTMARIQRSVNQQLFLGLFSYESHFAYYQVGDFYKKHLDAFKGEANRVLSTVCYLNDKWNEQDGGELVLYDEYDHTLEIARIQPKAGTLVIFLSENFPHEVLPANKTRHSIAGWFRVNASHSRKIDPPS